MRARSGLMRRSERLEGIGGFLSRAEGCWTFDARDRVPQSSPSTAHRHAQLRTGGDARPSRESGFVLCPKAVIFSSLGMPPRRGRGTFNGPLYASFASISGLSGAEAPPAVGSAGGPSQMA